MKFSSTWLKATLLGSAMLAMSFANAEDVKVSFNAPDAAAGTLKITYQKEGKTTDIEATGTTVAVDTELSIEVTSADATKTPKLSAKEKDAEAKDVPLTKGESKWTAKYPVKKEVVFSVIYEAAPATGYKLTETFENGITATYTPAIENKEKVKAGEYKVVFAVAEGKNLGEVKFDGKAIAPIAAEKPLEFKFTMPEKDAVLEAKLKTEEPPAKEYKVTFALNGAEVKVKTAATQDAPSKDVADGDKVLSGTVLVVEVTKLPENKIVDKITLGTVDFAQLPNFKYKAKMPAADAALTVVLKDRPADAHVHISWGPLEGIKMVGFREAKIENDEITGISKDNKEYATRGKEYFVFFTVDLENYNFASLATVETDKNGKSEESPVEAKYIKEAKNKDGVYVYHWTLFAWADDGTDNTVSCVINVKTSSKQKELKITPNGAEVKVMAGEKEIKDGMKVAPGTDLVITAKAPEGKHIEKVELGGRALKADKDGVYKTVMPDKDAELVVTVADGTAIENYAFAAVNVYPNPFAGKLTLNEVADASRVTLVNAQGVVLRNVAVNGANQIELDVADVPAGIYMVVVENGAARRTFKVVK